MGARYQYLKNIIVFYRIGNRSKYCYPTDCLPFITAATITTVIGKGEITVTKFITEG
jgi:hypothetical protein